MRTPEEGRMHALFLQLVAVGVLHMAEQLLFGIEEFHMIAGQVAAYHDLFPARLAGHASVILITVVVTAVSLLCYALLLGGRARLVAVGLFGLLGASEAHHVAEASQRLDYDPGLVTCLPYAWIGVRLLANVWQQFRALAAPQQRALGPVPA